jgi:two-component system NtrC family response regulator
MARDLAAAQKSFPAATSRDFGNSKPMARVSDADASAKSRRTCLHRCPDTGESGTGKEVVASQRHSSLERACHVLLWPFGLLLPGYAQSTTNSSANAGPSPALTAAPSRTLREASGGTIFIDEIGDLALPLQAKLLRALQERVVERLGSNVPRPVDVRVICATNRNLEQMVREGTFREDLYFRISVVKVQMPTLRDRAEDIPLLAEYFLRMFAKAHKKGHRNMTPGYLGALARHSWPGNVRELQNVIEP